MKIADGGAPKRGTDVDLDPAIERDLLECDAMAILMDIYIFYLGWRSSFLHTRDTRE